MKILYDYQAFDMQCFGGVSNCFVKLIENLPKGYDYEIALRESDNIHLKDSCLKVRFESRKLYEGNFIRRKKFKGRGWLYRRFEDFFPRVTSHGRNQQCSINALRKGDFDVFHPTFFHPYFLKYLNGKPYVLTIHDMIPELFFSNKHKQVRWKPILCERASHIIAVSEKTKEDLVNILHVPEEKINVIYHGAPEIKYNSLSKPIIDGRYILYVGQRSNYKNFLPMMKSLVPVLKRHSDINVICTGPELQNSELSELKKIGIVQRVLHYNVTDEMLANLYTHALFFIYPSSYEGFGIPILEAYNAHCPVFLNDASCFPEIAKDAAIYFHLDNSSSNLEQVVEKFLNENIIERNNLIVKQNKRLVDFSWSKSAIQLADVYQLVINKSKQL